MRTRSGRIWKQEFGTDNTDSYSLKLFVTLGRRPIVFCQGVVVGH